MSDAPDRLLLIEGYLPNDIRWMETRLGDGEEYIRKGAFPVEDIRREIDRQSGLTYQGAREVLIRILSLLESDDE